MLSHFYKKIFVQIQLSFDPTTARKIQKITIRNLYGATGQTFFLNLYASFQWQHMVEELYLIFEISE